MVLGKGTWHGQGRRDFGGISNEKMQNSNRARLVKTKSSYCSNRSTTVHAATVAALWASFLSFSSPPLLLNSLLNEKEERNNPQFHQSQKAESEAPLQALAFLLTSTLTGFRPIEALNLSFRIPISTRSSVGKVDFLSSIVTDSEEAEMPIIPSTQISFYLDLRVRVRLMTMTMIWIWRSSTELRLRR